MAVSGKKLVRPGAVPTGYCDLRGITTSWGYITSGACRYPAVRGHT